MHFTNFEHQCTANFKIHNYSRANPALQEALKDLPRLAALASHETGWKIEGTINIRILNSKNLRDTQAQYVHKNYISNLNTHVQKHVDTSQFICRLLYGKKNHHRTAGTTLNANNVLINAEPILTEDVELAAKRTILHELVHIAQYQNTDTGTQNAAINKAKRHVISTQGLRSKSLNAICTASNKLAQIHEGHARYIENKAAKEGKIESSGQFLIPMTSAPLNLLGPIKKLRTYASIYLASISDPYTLGENYIKQQMESLPEIDSKQVMQDLFKENFTAPVQDEINASNTAADKQHLLIHLSNHALTALQFFQLAYEGRKLVKSKQQ